MSKFLASNLTTYYFLLTTKKNMENKKLTRKERKAEWKHQVAQLFRLIDSYETENLDLALTIMSGNRDLKEACKRRYYPIMSLIDPNMGSSWQILYKVRETCENGYYTENDEYQYDFLNRLYRYYVEIDDIQSVMPMMQELFNEKYSYIYDINTLEELLAFKDLAPIAVKSLYISEYNKLLKKLPLQHLRSLESIEIASDKKALNAILPQLNYFPALTTLSISNILSVSLPPEIQFLTKLESLNISEVSIIELPDTFSKLQSLTALTISDARFQTIPHAISKLANLVHLNINNSHIAEIPDWLGQLEKLETLSLYNNQIKNINPAIFKLPNLASIDLDQNKIKDIPKQGVFSAPLLSTINIRENPLETFPIAFRHLPALTTLSLNNCKIKELPAEIGHFPALHTLNIENNKIQVLPDAIGNLKTLIELYVYGNSFAQFPKTVRTMPNLGYINFSLRQLKKYYKKEEHLAEALPPDCSISCY
jgi:Leucine-rich repeat (LRR) protein